MDAFDPLFQLRVTEYIVENGFASWFTWHDTMSWYPWGRNIARTSYPGIPFTGAVFYYLAQALNLDVTLYQVCLYFPVLMGAITCIAAYFLGKDLGGSTTGLLAAFFMAISEAFIGRTSLGFYDTENIGIFGMNVCVSMEKPGYRVNRRHINQTKIGNRQKLSRGEAINYIQETFGIEILEE